MVLDRISGASRARSIALAVLAAALVAMAVAAWPFTGGSLQPWILPLTPIPVILLVIGARYVRERAWLRDVAGLAGDEATAPENADRLGRLLARRPVLEASVAGIGALAVFSLGAAVLASPCASCGRTPDTATVLRGQLRRVQTAQELYYHARPGEMHYALDSEVLDFERADGVTIRIMSDDPATGYAAEASLAGSALTCSVWVGEENRVASAPEEGVAACGDEPEDGRSRPAS